MGLGPLGNLWLHRGAAEIKFSPKFIKARNRTNKKTEISLKKLFFFFFFWRGKMAPSCTGPRGLWNKVPPAGGFKGRTGFAHSLEAGSRRSRCMQSLLLWSPPPGPADPSSSCVLPWSTLVRVRVLTSSYKNQLSWIKTYVNDLIWP